MVRALQEWMNVRCKSVDKRLVTDLFMILEIKMHVINSTSQTLLHTRVCDCNTLLTPRQSYIVPAPRSTSVI